MMSLPNAGRGADGPPDRSAGATAGSPQPQPIAKRIVAAIVAGNALEFYDFVTYAFFAVYIGRAFFPAKTPFLSLLLSVAVFGVGFIFRPLGGFLIGAYADRAGRRPALLLTIVLITVGTIGLAVTPPYASIGPAAPVIVVVCRLVQGLALGGEVGPASAFLIEASPPGRRGLYASWQIASQGLAACAAGSFGLALSLVLTSAELETWGWRVPFVLCLLLVPVAVLLRRAMPETSPRGAATPTVARAPISAHARVLTLAVLVIFGGTVTTYVGTYMTTYAIATLGLPASTALAATVVFGAATAAFAVLGGALSDRYGRLRVMLIPRIALVLAIYPLFLLLDAHPTATTLLLATLALTGLTALSGATALASIPELLPRSVRATGLAVAYAVGVSLFGGTTQFIITYLIGATGDPTSPAWYVAFANLVTAVAIWLLPETLGRPLED